MIIAVIRPNPPPEPKGLFGWIWSTIRCTHADLEKTSGIDASAYVLFLETALILFTLLLVPGIGIIREGECSYLMLITYYSGVVLPVNFTSSNKDLPVNNTEHVNRMLIQ